MLSLTAQLTFALFCTLVYACILSWKVFSDNQEESWGWVGFIGGFITAIAAFITLIYFLN